MTDETPNPYSAPREDLAAPSPGAVADTGHELASRSSRLVAAIIDGLVYAPVFLPLVVAWVFDATMAGGDRDAATEGMLGFMGLMILCIFGLQATLLTRRGQSLGKLALGIRIVTPGGALPGFIRVVLLRIFLPAAIGAIPVVGGVFQLVDPLVIFRDSRRCLHDLMADTVVIEGHPPRWSISRP